MRGPRLLVLGILGVGAVAVACRGILGIDDDRRLLEEAGAIDAVDAGDAGDPDASDAARFCASLRPLPGFCDDFDDLPFEKQWDNYGTTPDPGVSANATLGPDENVFLSGPRSARFTVQSLLTPTNNAVSLLITTIPMGLRALQVNADIRIDTEYFPKADEGHMGLLTLMFIGGPGSVDVRRGKSGAFLYVTGSESALLEQPFPVGKWTGVEMRFEFDTTGGPDGKVVIYLNGVPAGRAPLPAGFYDRAVYPRLAVGPGVAYGASGEFRMNVDNVALTGSQL